ncbi:MAG: hypothetical protein K2X93_00950 [Candidatus Obscuribacterales bacterium]|nr:hypothetical protein [Candidatus Obscuribacterales bacterium]
MALNKKEKLFVFNSKRRPDFAPPDEPNETLSMIRSISGERASAGLVKLEDGSIVRIMKLNGFSLAFGDQIHRVCAAFESAIQCLGKNSRMQFLVINKPVDVERNMDAYAKLCVDDSPYLSWYADYTRKWFARVCEVVMVPNREFYVILVAESSKRQPRGESLQQQISTLSRLTNRVTAIFEKECLQPQLLSKAEVRRLLYSCMRPSYASGLREESVEVLNKSTLPSVRMVEEDGRMAMDSVLVSNQVVSDLPDQVKPGWLMSLVTFPFPSSLSIHVRVADEKKVLQDASSYPAELKRKINRLSTQSKRLIELSIYFSTYGDLREKPEPIFSGQIDAARALFSKHNALLTPDFDQRSAWLSGLPLGIDSGGIAHCLPVEQSGVFCPLVTGSCGDLSGWPMGFAVYSREPVFLNATNKLSIYALASKKADLSFFESLITLRMLSTNLRVLGFDDEKGTSSARLAELIETLGPNIASRVRMNESGSFVAEDTLFAETALTLLEIGKDLGTAATEKCKQFIIDWVKKYESGPRKFAFLLGDLNAFQGNTELLEFIYQLVEKKKLVVIAGNTVAQLDSLKRQSAIANQYSEVKLALPLAAHEHSLATKTLSLKSFGSAIPTIKKRSERQVPCFLRTQDNHGLMWLIPSPMDYWLCANHSRSNKEQIKRMKSEVGTRNPKLSKTDVARQTMYYLGLNDKNS